MDVHRKWYDMTCVVVYTNLWANESNHRSCRPGVYNFSRSLGPLKILGSKNVTWKRFYIEDSQISDATVKHLVATATCRPVIPHPCCYVWSEEEIVSNDATKYIIITQLITKFTVCVGMQ
jgi:hypothetical protein